MELIQNNIYAFGFLFAFLGWITNHARVLSSLSSAKGRIITPVWYIQNRPYKFATSITLTIMGMVINILTFSPAAITDGLVMVSYLASMAGSCFVADFATDKIGTREHHKREGTEPVDDVTLYKLKK